MTTKKNFSVNPNQSSSESLLKDIRRNTKRIFTSEQKVLIVMEGIRGEHSIAELCRKYGISDSTYYKWNKDFIFAADEFHHKTKFANEMWQTDFTYFKVKGWGWYYLSTVIDDYSRYIIHWELCSSMTSDDVSRTIDKAIEKAGVTFQNPPCLLSDNGPCYIASSLKQYLCKEYNIKHIHGKPLHPQTQGKIERYQRTMKNVIKLNHYFCPSELENAIDGWVKYYNERRFHESLDNLTPKDVYLG